MTGARGAEAAAFNGKFSDIGQIAGVAAVAGFTAPKLLWLQAHEPKVFKQLAMVLAPKDYLRFRMSGDFITDPCDATGMSLLDVRQRKWSPALVEAAGIRLENLPRIEEGTRASAHLHKSAADFLGLPVGLPIATGAGDAAASAIGIGAINDGDGFISLGTSAQYFVTTNSFRPRPQQMIQALGHGLPDLWYQVAALLNGASPLSWLNGILPGGNIQKLLQRTQRRYRGPGRLLFLPYLNGERTPHNDPAARAAFHGLHAGTTQEDLALAVLEGVAPVAGGLPGCSGAGGHARCGTSGGRRRYAQRLLDAASCQCSQPADYHSQGLGCGGGIWCGAAGAAFGYG